MLLEIGAAERRLAHIEHDVRFATREDVEELARFAASAFDVRLREHFRDRAYGRGHIEFRAMTAGVDDVWRERVKDERLHGAFTPSSPRRVASRRAVCPESSLRTSASAWSSSPRPK